MPRTKKPKVCPFTVVVDTREQAPYGFENVTDLGFDVINVVHRALPTGDYSIQGLEDVVCVERKSVSDFYHSIGSDRERFEREVVRMKSFQAALIVIEGGFRDLTTDRPDTIQMSAKAAIHTIISWEGRYRVPIRTFDGGRGQAEKWTFHFLRHFWNYYQETLVDAETIESVLDRMFA